jgi:hypothetical protein
MQVIQASKQQLSDYSRQVNDMHYGLRQADSYEVQKLEPAGSNGAEHVHAGNQF